MDRIPGTFKIPYENAVNSLVWIKVVGIGNANVGKTCLIKHFCESKDCLVNLTSLINSDDDLEDQFSAGYQPTVGVDYGFKVQEVGGKDLRVHLWDLSGSNEFFDVRNELYTGTDAIFLVFDVTNSSSFENLDQWLREVSRYANGHPHIVIVGNKADLKQKRAITSSEGKAFAQAHKCRYYETSAANGEGVTEMFEDLLKAVCQKPPSSSSASPSATGDRKPSAGVRKESQATDIYRKASRS